MAWLTVAAGVLILQWIYLIRRLELNHRPGENSLLPGFGPGTWITLLRGLLLAGSAGFLTLPKAQGILAWAPMALFTAAISLDLLDGYVARRFGQVTRLGEALELGMDSLAMLAGSGLAVRLGVLPWWYLSFGLASPAFRLGLWLRRRLGLGVRELPDSRIRRAIAGFSMGFLSGALWPIVSPLAATWVGLLFLIPFLGSFGRDWAAVSGIAGPDQLGLTRGGQRGGK
jgi:CDP-diacylglycerol--glycerol-3-phosphate 3-phosphatidyltransferase